MIGRLRGTVASIGADHLLIDVGGVGYVAAAGTSLLSKVAAGEPAELHVETLMSENAIKLYAFETDEARAWFVRLQDVPGVGAKAAMAVLDALGPSGLMDAIALGDAASVKRAKGVGQKLAERIVGELAGKPPPMGRFGAFEADASASARSQLAAATTGSRGEAVSALVNLGYAQADAARAVAAAAKGDDGKGVESLIKEALKELAS
ncbi:MAG: Holliday junction branch migration protein RuvA [Pseudomonadota bacterium]